MAFRKLFFTGLAIGLLPLTANAGVLFSVRSDVDDTLYRIDRTTGVATAIGNGVGFADVEGFAFDPLTGALFAADDASNQLITIDVTTGIGTAIGAFNVNPDDPGLAIDASGDIFMVREDGISGSSDLFSINRNTGAATFIGSTGIDDITGLTTIGEVLYGVSDLTDSLYTLDKSFGNATLVGALGVSVASELGAAYDVMSGQIIVLDDDGVLVGVDPLTGAGTEFAFTTLDGFDGLAIQNAVNAVPEPQSLATFALLFGAGLVRSRRRRK
ncbi:MAG: hypothetical protein AAFX06_28530 [Planctomycetota bacterium]